MPRPGVDVFLVDNVGAVTLPTDTGVAFVTGLTDRGPLGPVLIQSLAQFIGVFGDRQSYSVLYDWLDEFFTDGGNSVYISRVVGPAATAGTHNLVDGSAAVSLIVSANGPGAWSSGYKIQVLAGTVGGTYQIQILDANNNVLENSGNLVDQQSAYYWSQNSNYVRIALGAATDNPVVAAAVALSAGTDDRLNITDAQWQAAQDLFVRELGPGQVVQPGRTTTTAYQQVAAHAAANNRVGLVDLQDTATEATLEAAAGAIASREVAAFAPWVVIPGITDGSFRTVPPTALIAALVARNDASLGPNRAAAGNAGVSRYAVGVSQPAWSDAVRTNLNAAGVNVIRAWPSQGGVRNYGWRSTTNAVSDSNWIDFGNGRLNMAISAGLDNVGENFVFEEIDGPNGETINAFNGALAGEMLDWFNRGQLYGDTTDEAFLVDTGPSVNTPQTIANNELHADVYYRAASMAEWVRIGVTKTPVTSSIPGT